MGASVQGFFKSDGWKKFVQIVELTGAVVGVISLFILGLGWLFASILMASSLVSLVDSVAKFMDGEIGFTELMLNSTVAVLGLFAGVASVSALKNAVGKTITFGMKYAQEATKAQIGLAKLTGFSDYVVTRGSQQFFAKDAIRYGIANNLVKSIMPKFVKGDILAGEVKFVWNGAFSAAKDAASTFNFMKSLASSAKDIYMTYINPARQQTGLEATSVIFKTIRVVAPGVAGDLGDVINLMNKVKAI